MVLVFCKTNANTFYYDRPTFLEIYQLVGDLHFTQFKSQHVKLIVLQF